ncbi:MAG: FAD-dependent monooxygenase [Vicinamibacterales bacterium]
MYHRGVIEVGIVGAGPAGAWTARQLAARGVRVALFDGSHPREKPCGGGVTNRALRLIEAALPAPVDGIPIDTARFMDADGGLDCVVPLSHRKSPLLVTTRRHFDQQLLEAAGAAGATFVPARVTRIEALDRGFRLHTTSGVHQCRRLVGADGANSLVRRSLATALARTDLSVATGFYVWGVTSRDILLEFVADPPGYLWSFPRPDHLAVGICAQASTGVMVTVLRARLLQWMHKTGIARGSALQPYSWPIPSLGEQALRGAKVAGSDWCLVGDAAGLVDPITREGIFFALQSAQCAADALMSVPDAMSEHYSRQLQRDILPELTRAAQIKETFFRPQFVRLVLHALGTSVRVREVMADLIAGDQPYRGLERRLLQTWEFRLAWRLLNARRRSSHHALAPGSADERHGP